MKTTKVPVNNICEVNRFDASYHLSDGVYSRQVIHSAPYPITTIGVVSKRIFHAGRWKRAYVSSLKKGVALVGSSDMLRADLTALKRISRKYTPDFEDKKLEKGWILISCSGTIGNSVFTTKQHAEKLASQHVIRIIPNNILRAGYVYAYLSSKYGFNLLTQGTFGAVIQHIEPSNVSSIPIPVMPDNIQKNVDDNILKASSLREEAAELIANAEMVLKKSANLLDLTEDDYDFFGPRDNNRTISCFTRNIKDIGTTSFNAFNNSERIRIIKQGLTAISRPIKELIEGGQTFSSGSIPSIEVKPGHGIMLINQKDIFDNIVVGKYISSKNANLDDLVQYGEILIASDGTLGENELFCRAIFANEDLAGSFISSHFLRMRTNGIVPVGYLFSWLNSDYGFRLIRNTQAGTKICHPIQKMFQEIPVPIISDEKMKEIDQMVRMAFTKRHQANNLEKEAIRMVETEIDKWNKN